MSNSVRRTAAEPGDEATTSATTTYVDERTSRSTARRVRSTPARVQSQRATATVDPAQERRLRAGLRHSLSQRSPAHSRSSTHAGAWKLRYRDFVPASAVPGTTKTVETFQ